jgi:hypothetical protein
MKNPTLSFAIISFGLLALTGCNTASQNTYSAAAPTATSVDSKQAEIERLCKMKFWAAGARPGANVGDSGNAYADCMLRYSKP